ncbi:aspartate/glutamate racemase family protein [Rhizobium sp. BR 314]|uniref:aspartate/glutamate racemase family protein n=1 Tax=Rhizobium sp. BR 314 TaxID=3040013 RepID=UPI0039BFFC4D
MRLLLINPNTTASMTEKAAIAARAVAGVGTEIIAVTSQTGPASIEGYYDGALAVPGMLRELKLRQVAGYDAVIICCFDDTGLDAARMFCDVPVVGLCEAAVATAGFIAQRFSVVTTLERSRILIDNLVQRYGMGARAKVHASDIPVLELENSSSGAIGKLRATIEQALAEDGSEAIVLGCAGMTDLARDLQLLYGVPVVDGVAAAVKQAEALVSLGLGTSKRSSYAAPLPKPFLGAMQEFAPVSSIELTNA